MSLYIRNAEADRLARAFDRVLSDENRAVEQLEAARTPAKSSGPRGRQVRQGGVDHAPRNVGVHYRAKNNSHVQSPDTGT